MRDHHFFVYIMASKSRVIYVGRTNDLTVRVFQHKTGRYKGFTQRCEEVLASREFDFRTAVVL